MPATPPPPPPLALLAALDDAAVAAAADEEPDDDGDVAEPEVLLLQPLRTAAAVSAIEAATADERERVGRIPDI
jgi:hypothetical protein